MKTFISLLTIISLTVSQVMAGEGMWVLSLIGKNYQQMKEAGFRLTPEDIYSINQTCLKDAIVSLNDGECTAEFVSTKGMLLTNHHCGYEDIQSISSVSNDYLTNGFWAKKMADEIPIKGKTAALLISIEDVTDKILTPSTLRLGPESQIAVIEGTIESLEEEYSENGKYKAEISNFFNGNYYYMFKYVVYKDIRLVGAPPESIGQFGGENDNFAWPRQGADFCIFRVYTAPDGSPAEYSEKNIPYVPQKYLKINTKGVNEGDFAMIIGYPAETQRHYSPRQIRMLKDNSSVMAEALKQKLDITKSFMDADDAIRIQYASKLTENYNAYKYYYDTYRCINDLKVIERRQKAETDLDKWISADKKSKYKKVIQQYNNDLIANSQNDIYMNYWLASMYAGCEFVKFGSKHYMLYHYLSIGYRQKVEEIVKELKANSEAYFRNYNPKIDYTVSKQMLKYYVDHVPQKYCPAGSNDSAFFLLLEQNFTTSILTDKDRYNNFLKNPSAEALSQDLLFLLAVEIVEKMDYFQASDALECKTEVHYRDYTKAMMEMAKSINPDTLFYPDANSTMRLTYGKVCGYTYQGKDMGWYTTFESLIAKKNNNDRDFMVLPELQNLFDKRDFGTYAYNDTLRLCFLTDNDISGGNSGSAVLNGDGEIIGLAFDGNQEAMSCDIMFEPDIQRTICVDIRYVLFIIDKFANAGNIINELEFIN